MDATEILHGLGPYFQNVMHSVLMSCTFVISQVGAWRDRIVICTGRYGLVKPLIKAFLDSGAKAVICPSGEPPQMQSATFHGSGDFDVLESGKFELGEDEAEDEEPTEPVSPISDWEDSDFEKSTETSKGFWDHEEEELSHFVCHLYESLFREGGTVHTALQSALGSYRKLRYSCHLPSMP